MAVQSTGSRYRGLKGTRCAIRADASSAIGSGHIMRCLTLAHALREKGALVAFLSRELPGDLNHLVRARGFEVMVLAGTVDAGKDAAACLEWLEGWHPEWLVVDHYGLDATWERRLRDRTRNIMVIDDIADRRHDCELLLDQNLSLMGAARYDGLVPAACTRLVGPCYALLREEFQYERGRGEEGRPSCRRLLVFFGGADECDMTRRALRALNQPGFSGLEIDVVVGSSNPHLEDVRREAARNPAVTLHVDIDHMAQRMAEADLALGAGGGATWERCCVGLPTIVVTVASNQRPAATVLDQKGVVEWLGEQGEVDEHAIRHAVRRALDDPPRLREMRRRARQLVDGRGTARVVDFLERGIPESRWRIRAAGNADCPLFFEWANDPDTRRNAFDPRSIEWENHRRWFVRKLADPGVTLLVAESGEGPIGQVRFEKQDARFVISYSLGRQFRGKGLGRGLLARAIEVFKRSATATLEAETRLENVPSARVFESLGFVEVDPRRPGSRRFQLPAEVCP